MKAAVTLAAVLLWIIIAVILRNRFVRKFRANIKPGDFYHYYVNEDKYYGEIIKIYLDTSILVMSETGVYSYVKINDIYP